MKHTPVSRELIKKIHIYKCVSDTRWRSWLKHCATSQIIAGLVPDDVIGCHYGPGVEADSKRNEYQEYFLG
jgi:hypothetical protein